jgi:hypothetical protein
MWVPGCLDDIESDMSVFHRVDDIYSMPGPRFFRLAARLSAYEGAMRLRAMAEGGEAGPAEAAAAVAAAPVSRLPVSVTERPGNLPATAQVVRSDPAFAGVFSFGTITRE